MIWRIPLYFNNYTSEEKDGEYVMKGQVHYAAADDDDACAVWIHAAQDTEVPCDWRL